VVEEPTFPGCVVPSRPIGTLLMRDEHGDDEKILGVPVGDPRFDEVRALGDLGKHWLREIETFFATYKELESNKSAEVKGYNEAAAPQDRARRHLAYERYLIEEVLPAIRYANAVDQLIVTGSSFGAFHALAFVTRRPGIARKAVGMSGAYDTARWLDGERGG